MKTKKVCEICKSSKTILQHDGCLFVLNCENNCHSSNIRKILSYIDPNDSAIIEEYCSMNNLDYWNEYKWMIKTGYKYFGEKNDS